MYHFRCNNCGRPATGDDAGRHSAPRACVVCGQASWEVLTPHTPHTEADSNRADHARCAAELAKLAAKETAWNTLDKEKTFKEWSALKAQVTALSEAESPADLDARDKCTQQLAAIEASEWTERDAHHKAALETRIALGAERRMPSSKSKLFVMAKDTPGAKSITETK